MFAYDALSGVVLCEGFALRSRAFDATFDEATVKGCLLHTHTESTKMGRIVFECCENAALYCAPTSDDKLREFFESVGCIIGDPGDFDQMDYFPDTGIKCTTYSLSFLALCGLDSEIRGWDSLSVFFYEVAYTTRAYAYAYEASRPRA